MICTICSTKLLGLQKKFCSAKCSKLRWRRDNLERVRAATTIANRRNTKTRKDFVNNLKDNPCTDCGIKYPYYVMDFDHVRGEKVMHIGDIRHYGWGKIKAELEKCELVCSNCHRARTHNRREKARELSAKGGKS